jgi:glycosyltransferase involved in cell wall biosynthesis
MKRSHQVFVFTQDRNGTKEAFLKNVQVKWFRWMKSEKPLVILNPFNPSDCLRIVNLFHSGKRELVPFLKENKIDACLGLWVLPGGYFANHGQRRTGIPYSVWALGSDIYRHGKNPFLYLVMRRIIHEARGVFADGFDLLKVVEERFHRRCEFLATTRKIPPPSPLLKGRRGGLISEPYRFLFVGRIEKIKGIDLLLQSVALLKEETQDFHLTIVGKGGMEEWARNFIKVKEIGERVAFMENVSDEALASLYASSRCVVIPSRSESIPLVFSEALNFGKELIVTDVGDMGMLGREYGVAWVVPPEDPVALKESMKRKIDVRDKGEAEKDVKKRGELQRLFNIETSVERFLADYE